MDRDELTKKLNASAVQPDHPLAELLGTELFGIEIVPPKEKMKMVENTVKVAAKWAQQFCKEIVREKKQRDRLGDLVVEPNHPIVEMLACKLFSIETVPQKEQTRMVRRAIREAVKWAKENAK
ncbi:MAG: hypothetical protein ACTSSP_05710 [Candidatus Asgardarchaeia archaeon]